MATRRTIWTSLLALSLVFAQESSTTASNGGVPLAPLTTEQDIGAIEPLETPLESEGI